MCICYTFPRCYTPSNHLCTLRDNYDAVIHLCTAAKGAVEFYTTANNEARTETVEQGQLLIDSNNTISGYLIRNFLSISKGSGSPKNDDTSNNNL